MLEVALTSTVLVFICLFMSLFIRKKFIRVIGSMGMMLFSVVALLLYLYVLKISGGPDSGDELAQVVLPVSVYLALAVWSFIKKNYVVWKVLQVYEKTRAIAMLPASFHRFYFAIRGISDNAFATY